MDSFGSLHADFSHSLAQSGLPRKVLRHLILDHDIWVGAKVLVAGCGTGELVRFFDLLGFEASGLDDSPTRIATATHAYSHLEFACGRAHESIPFAEGLFDLIVIQSVETYGDNLLSADALKGTAALLSCVKPGGVLVCLSRTDNSAPTACVHDSSCFVQHFAPFGRLENTAEFAASSAPAEGLKWIAGRASKPSFRTATFRTPKTARSRADWLARAVAGAQSAPDACHQVIAQFPQAIQRRSAA